MATENRVVRDEPSWRKSWVRTATLLGAFSLVLVTTLGIVEEHALTLSVALEPTPPKVALTDAVRIVGTIRNTGSAPTAFWKAIYWGDGPIRFAIETEDGEPVRKIWIDDWFGSRRTAELTLLEPGEQLVFSRVLDAAHLVSRPGSYRMRLAYRVPSRARFDRQPASPDDSVSIWPIWDEDLAASTTFDVVERGDAGASSRASRRTVSCSVVGAGNVAGDNALALSVELRQSVATPEIVTIAGTIRNESRAAVAFWKAFEWAGGPARYVIVTEDGEDVPAPVVDEAGGPRRPAELTVLEPGEEIVFPRYVLGENLVERPGAYRLHLTYHVPSSYRCRQPSERDPSVPIWKEVLSASTAFEVLE